MRSLKRAEVARFLDTVKETGNPALPKQSINFFQTLLAGLWMTPRSLGLGAYDDSETDLESANG
jgi:hypothetical protein